MSRTLVGARNIMDLHQRSSIPVMGGVSHSSESGEVMVAVDVIAVEQFQNLCPVWEEQEVGEARSVDADEDVRVVSEAKLGGEGGSRIESGKSHLYRIKINNFTKK